MADARTIRWTGESGREYLYYIYPIGEEFGEMPGNYVFAKETKPGYFRPIYAGETGDLSDRFDNHHKMRCILRNGATHITVHASSEDDEVRRAEEADIIAAYEPVCNG